LLARREIRCPQAAPKKGGLFRQAEEIVIYLLVAQKIKPKCAFLRIFSSLTTRPGVVEVYREQTISGLEIQIH
jgi:hypothetical protein